MNSSAPGEERPPFIVAIGASGGKGLEDIKVLLATLTAELSAVVLVVLRRPTDRLSHLKDALSRVSQMPVLVAAHGEHFRAGCCYICEPHDHLSLAAKSNVRLVEGTQDKHRNRTVTILFNSIAAHAKRRAIGALLSGSLDDGSRGLAAISHAGGTTMVLTKRGVAEYGMPENAAGYNGPIDVLGSATIIAREIVQRVGQPQCQRHR